MSTFEKIKLDKNEYCWSIPVEKLENFNLIFNEMKEIVKVFINKSNIEMFKNNYNNSLKYHYEKTKTIPNKKELENYFNNEKFSHEIHILNKKIDKNKKEIEILDKCNDFNNNVNNYYLVKKLDKEIKKYINEKNKLSKYKNLISNYKLDIDLSLNNLFIENIPIKKYNNNFNGDLIFGYGCVAFLNNKFIIHKFNNLLKECNCDCKISGLFWYPPGGYREWHTNCYNRCDWTLYVVYVEEDNKSWFNYIHPTTKEYISIPDKNKHINIFFLKKDEKNPFWHNVRSDTNRLSIGLSVTNEFIERNFEFV